MPWHMTFLNSVVPPPSDSGSLKTSFILRHAIVVFNLLKQILWYYYMVK